MSDRHFPHNTEVVTNLTVEFVVFKVVLRCPRFLLFYKNIHRSITV